MNGNTDFKIFLGLELEKNAGTTLNQEITKLTKSGINLKVGLDEKTLTSLTNSINGITQQLQKMGTLGASSGKGIAQGFNEANKSLTPFRDNIIKTTEEYKKGVISAEEYSRRMGKALMVGSDKGLSPHFANQLQNGELEEYLKLVKNVGASVREIEPIGDLFKTEEISVIKGQTAELTKEIKTYKDDMGGVQTITSLINKENGELVATTQKLVTLEQYQTEQKEKQNLAIAKQGTSLEKYKRVVQEINSFGLSMIKSGNATSADNEMIKNANAIKKEYEELNKLNQDGVLIDDIRVQKFKTLLEKQQNFIKLKDTEIKKSELLEQSLYERDRLTKQMQESFNKQNSSYSTGIDENEKNAVQELINAYGKLDPSKENMKRKTEELKDSVSSYNEKLKESATLEQKQAVAQEKHSIAIQKLENAFKNTNKKYELGVDNLKSDGMKAQIEMFKELDPLSKTYAQDLERIRMNLAQYTVDTRNSTNEMGNQIKNITKLNSLQQSLNNYTKNTKGFYNEAEAKSLQGTLKTMREMIASGQDVSLMFGNITASVRKFGNESTQAMKNSVKATKEEQKLLLAKQKMLFDLKRLEAQYSKKNLDTSGIVAMVKEVEKLSIETKDVSFEVKKLLEQLRQMKAVSAGTSGKSFFGDVLKTAGGLFSIYQMIGHTKRAITSLVQEVTALDDAMIGLSRVTDESASSYEAFMHSAFQTADQIGGSAKEIVDSASEFAKLGYSFAEAQQLATDATKYATAGEVSMEEATNALSASYTVFGGTIDNVTGKLVDSTAIIDLYNKIGNTMAVTSGDIGEAMKASANSLSLANNSLSESVALIATANKTVQDSSKVGNALRTISMRIRGVSEDAGELLPKMDELINKGTNGKVNIMDGENFKSTYQIMLEISEVWDELSDKQRAYLAENIAGKNRAEVFTAIMGNAEDLTYAMEMAQDSLGSVDEEMAVVMQSFQKRVEVMKNAWVSLGATTISSDFVKGIVDATTSLIKFADVCGGLVPVLASVGVAFAVFKFAPMVNTVANLTQSFMLLIPALKGATGAVTALNMAMSLSVIGGISAVIMGVGFALNYASKEAERLRDAVVETENKIADLNGEIAGLNSIENKTDAQKERLRLLNEELVVREKILESQKKEEVQSNAGRAIIYKGEVSRGSTSSATSQNTGELGDVANAVLDYKQLETQIDKLREKQKGLSDDDEEYIKVQDKINKKLDEARTIRNTLTSTLGKLKDSYDLLSESQKKQYDLLTQESKGVIESIDNKTGDFDMSDVITKNKSALQELIKQEDAVVGGMEEASSSAIDYEAEAKKLGVTVGELKIAMADLREEQEKTDGSDGMGESFDNLGEMFSSAVDSSDILKTSLMELDKEHTLSQETVDALVKKYPELANKIKDVDSAYTALNQKISENEFDKATQGMSDLTSILEDLEAGNGITASSFKKLTDSFPELLAYMDDEANLTDAIKSKMNDLKNVQNDAYKQMLINSESYYKANVLGNEQMISSISKGIETLFRNLGTAYEGDLNNWKSLAQGKADIETQLISSLNKEWEKHFGTLMTQFNKMANTPIATPQFDKEGYMANYQAENPFATGREVELQAKMAEQMFANQKAQYKQFQADAVKRNQELASMFDGIEFDPIDIKVGGSKASSSKKGGKGNKASYVASIFQEIVEEILRGGEEIETSMKEVEVKLDHAVLMGDEAVEEQLLAKMSNLQVALRDKQASMAKELDAQISEMGNVLSKTGAFKAYDIAKLTAKDIAEVIQDIEKQINSATLGGKDSEVDRLNNLKSLISDVGSVYIDTIQDRRELSSRWWEEETTRLEKYAENLEKFYSKKFEALDREDKILQLRKSMLLEDGDRYDKEEKDADKILDINQQLFANIVKKRELCESQIAQLRAKNYSDESDEIQALIDKWLDYEQARIDMIKEIAEAKRQNEIDSANRELNDLTEAKDNMKSLLDLTMDMLKKETEAKKDALKEQTDAKKEALKEEYDADKKALQDKLDLLKEEADARKSQLDKEKRDRDYEDNVAEKQKEIATLKQQILELSNDDSASSVKKRKELEAELDKYLKELEKMQDDRSTELQKEAIDEELKNQEDKIEKELESLEEQYDKEMELLEEKYNEQLKEYEDYLKNQTQLKEEANKLIESKDKAFYERLKSYAMDYTDTTQAEFEDCWNKAYEALDKYGNKQLDVIDVIEMMTERVIDLNAELKRLNDTTYKDFIQDDGSTSDDDFGFAGDGGNSDDKYGGETDKKAKEEFRDKQLQKMIDLGNQMDATPKDDTTTIKKLKDQQKEIAKTIGAYQQGDNWYIMINDKKYRVRDAVGVRHTGLKTGEVGAPWGSFKVKSNEELNKLKNGEIVLNDKDTSAIMQNVKSLAQNSSTDGLQVVIDMHDFSVTEDTLPKFERLIRDRVPKIINDALFSKGIK